MASITPPDATTTSTTNAPQNPSIRSSGKAASDPITPPDCFTPSVPPARAGLPVMRWNSPTNPTSQTTTPKTILRWPSVARPSRRAPPRPSRTRGAR